MNQESDNQLIARALKFYADFIERKLLLPPDSPLFDEQKKFIEKLRGMEGEYRKLK